MGKIRKLYPSREELVTYLANRLKKSDLKSVMNGEDVRVDFVNFLQTLVNILRHDGIKPFFMGKRGGRLEIHDLDMLHLRILQEFVREYATVATLPEPTTVLRDVLGFLDSLRITLVCPPKIFNDPPD